MAAQVENTHPRINLTAITDPPSPLTLHNLDDLNSYGRNGLNVFLTSDIDVTTSPTWLEGVVPDSTTGKTHNAISCAIVINDHGSGFVDAFYMYFYAFNQGNTFWFRELGDHIGDWEHNMIRFQDGEPQAIWYSQHGNGQAFKYEVVEKQGKRPITYSAKGSHASYAVAGIHDHTIPDLNLPAGFLLDYTSQGLLWDPTLSAYFYNYDPEFASFESINDSPVAAMTFKGRWGDEQYPDEDPRQPPPFFGFRKFVGGPTGPWDKQLNRTKVCPETGIPCIIRSNLGA
jgi:Vacuolar protein sorting-associated protein 62